MGGEVQSTYAQKDSCNFIKSPKPYHMVLRKAVQSTPDQNSVFAMASLYIYTHFLKSYSHKMTLYLFHYSQYYNCLSEGVFVLLCLFMSRVLKFE